MNKVAVILAGCGYLDGSEIRESVLSLLALESENVKYEIFALDEMQHHVSIIFLMKTINQNHEIF